jgi:DNA-binding NarL/FixJ family response regulator
MKKLAGRSAVVVDSHPLWLDGMGRLLDGVGIQVLAKTTESTEVVELVSSHGPDILMIGLGTGPADAELLEAARTICAGQPEIRLVLLAPAADDRAIDDAFAMGATAYCIKSAGPDDLLAAIRQSFEQSIYLAASRGGQNGKLHTTATAPVVQGEFPVRGVEDQDRPELTKRELEILRLVAEGHSNSQLARMLWVTEQTIKFHLSNIYRKLNVANRTEASRWAQVHGLLTEQTWQMSQSAA